MKYILIYFMVLGFSWSSFSANNEDVVAKTIPSTLKNRSFADLSSRSPRQITKTRYYAGLFYTIGTNIAYYYSVYSLQASPALLIGTGFLATGGLGHAIQGRYFKEGRGWIFTLANVVEGGLAIGTQFLLSGKNATKNSKFALIPLGITIGFKLLEIVDLAWLPKSTQLVENLSIQPLITPDAKVAGLNLNYQF